MRILGHKEASRSTSFVIYPQQRRLISTWANSNCVSAHLIHLVNAESYWVNTESYWETRNRQTDKNPHQHSCSFAFLQMRNKQDRHRDKRYISTLWEKIWKIQNRNGKHIKDKNDNSEIYHKDLMIGSDLSIHIRTKLGLVSPVRV